MMGPEESSATFPPQRSPWSRAGTMSRSRNRSGIFTCEEERQPQRNARRVWEGCTLSHVWLRMAVHGSGRVQGHLPPSIGQAHPPPVRHTSHCCTWLATSPWWGCRAWWAQGAAGLSHLQSRPELEGISVPRPLRQHVHLGLDALLGIECDPVLLPVIHLHKRQQRRKPSSEAHARAEGGTPKWERLIA